MPQLTRRNSLVLFQAALGTAHTAPLMYSLTHPRPFRGGGLKPALTQHPALPGRQPGEVAEVLAHQFPFARFQFLEALPAMADQLASFFGQLAPGPKAFTRPGTLFRRHAEPAIRASCQRLLARGRQRGPIAGMGLQEFLLPGAQRRPIE